MGDDEKVRDEDEPIDDDVDEPERSDDDESVDTAETALSDDESVDAAETALSDDESVDAAAGTALIDEDDVDTADVVSPWRAKVRRAGELWEAGNNAELRPLIEELKKAPAEEKEALAVAEEMARRLKPDPIAIGLWLVTLAVFCLLTYLFVIR